MTGSIEDTHAAQALRGLEHASASVRLQAALAVGTTPDPRFIDRLVERCGIEPDFYVRDMLTWALTRHPSSATVPRLIRELAADRSQARSQALHTLSKIGDRTAYPAITEDLLTDADPDVARSAWRTAVVLVPPGEETALARVLLTQLGRGEREMQRSLSRALVALGEVIVPGLRTAMTSPDPRVRQHATATERLLHDPEVGFEYAIEEAKRIVALGPTRGEG
jgi:HEAT repeat protein